VLAHELGHVLGLRDIEASRGCPAFMMSEVVEDRPTLQRVGRDECRAVDRKWLTSDERNAGEAVVLAGNDVASVNRRTDSRPGPRRRSRRGQR
jgi:hypothetical protein